MTSKTKEQRLLEWERDKVRTKASAKESTWNGKQHTCCQSKKGLRHKVSCVNALCNKPDDLSDLKD